MATKDKQVDLGNAMVDRPVGFGGAAAADSPILKAEEVQDVVSQRARDDEQSAASAAALQVEGNPLQLNGIGRNGNGNWYSLVGPGGTVKPENAAAFLAMGPGAYSSPYAPAMQELMNQLLSPGQFKYDVNADGLYQQIKDNYTKAGRQAMMDTQGQSAALTGGYGNSYGSMAGQQAYQESLGSMAGMIPELQQLAYQQWLNGEDAKRNNLEALNKLDAQEYARWQDEMAAYQEMLKNVPDYALAGGGGANIGVVGTPNEGYGTNLVHMMPGTTGEAPVNMNTVQAYVELFTKYGDAAPAVIAYLNNGGKLNVGTEKEINLANQIVHGTAQQSGAQTGQAPAQQSTPSTGQQTSSQSVAQRNTQFLKNVVQGIAGIFGPKK